MVVWALMNRFTGIDIPTLQIEIDIAGVEASTRQVRNAYHRYRHGDRGQYQMLSADQLTTIFNRRRPELYNFAFEECGNAEMARDMVAEAFATASLQLARYLVGDNGVLTLNRWLTSYVHQAASRNRRLR